MRRSSGSVKWPLTVGCGVILLLIVGLISFLAISLRPTPMPPAPKMPVPNGYDYFLRASQSIVDGTNVSQAAGGPGNQSEAKKHVYTLEEKSQLVQANAATLTMMRQGFLYDCRVPRDPDPVSQHTRIAGLRELARLILLEGQVKAGASDWSGTSNSYSDAMRLGAEIQRGGPVLTMLVGSAVQSIGRRDLWDVLNKLNAEDSRALASQLEEIADRRVSFAEVLQEEKWISRAFMESAMTRPPATGSSPVPPSASGGGAIGKVVGRFMTRKSQAYFDQCIVAAQKPRFSPPLVPSDELAKITAGTVTKSWFAYARNQVQNDLLLLTVALRAYHLEHGEYPSSLSELVPEYIKKIPDDLFAPSGTFHYRKTGDKYVLYSVGPDGKDDGARPIVNPVKSADDADRRYYVDQSSRGDIVAGVNR